MKILHIITRMILGGAQENTMLTVLGQDAREDCESVLLTGPTTGPEGCIVPEMKARGGRVIEEPTLVRQLAPLKDLAAYRALRRHIRNFAPDVVHTHSSKAGILGRLAAWHERVPLVVHTIHGLPFHPYQSFLANRLYVNAERFAAKRCHKIACVADAMMEQALAVGVGRREQFSTVYSGMEIEPFLRRDRDHAALRREWGLAPDDLVIGKVARIFELKGHEYLFEAFKQLRTEFPKLKLFLVGDGLWMERFHNMAQENGFGDRVVFAGLVPRDRIDAAIATMDFVAHCSLREGLARVLPQAFLSGKPVISFDVDGAREVVRPDETGWLVPPRDVKGLVEVLREAISNPRRADELARAGCELCRKRFDWHAMVDELCHLYRENLPG